MWMMPVALAVLKYGDGEVLKTLRTGVCYGRDGDSIAGMVDVCEYKK